MRDRLARVPIVVHFFLAAVVLAVSARSSAAADGTDRDANPPTPARIVSVLQGEQPPATPPAAGHLNGTEGVPYSVGAATLLPGRENTTVVTEALARPQPQVQAASKLGSDEALLQGAGTTRPWGMSASAWEAPAFCHRPLYFEDENLERHGHSFGLIQPAVSAGHFVGRGLAWPYLAGAFPPHECIYTLGRERPGSYAPYRLYRPPVSARGAVYEGAAIAGLSFVVP